MSRSTTMMIAIGTATALTVCSTVATAQNIQRFDDQVESEAAEGDSGGNVVLPGAPAPQQEQQVVEQEGSSADAEESAEDEGPTGSYRISVHDDRAGDPGRSDTDDLLSEDHTALYQGIIPGERDAVDHLQAAREAAETGSNQITWVGFKPEDDRTRVFFQSPHPVEYQIQEDFSDGELVVIFDSAEIPERNFTRFIDASHFNRAVDRIEAEETGDGNVKITFNMNEDVAPTPSVDGEYLYLDFAHDAGSDADDVQADAE